MRLSIALLAGFAGLATCVAACSEKHAAEAASPDAGRALDPTIDPAGGRFLLADAVAGLGGSGELRAKIETKQGTMIAKLYEQGAPITVANFVGLARGTRPFRDVKTNLWVKRPFYDGLTFHRVIKEFMIQGGDPLANSKGGPGYKFDDEFNDTLHHDQPGTLSMASGAPGTNGSQFFITARPAPHLDHHHTVFGELVEGLEVVKKIAAMPVDGEKKPLEPVVISKVTVYRQ